MPALIYVSLERFAVEKLSPRTGTGFQGPGSYLVRRTYDAKLNLQLADADPNGVRWVALELPDGLVQRVRPFVLRRRHNVNHKRTIAAVDASPLAWLSMAFGPGNWSRLRA